MNTRLLVCRMSKLVQRPKWKDFAYKERDKIGNLAIWGEVTTGTILTMWADMVDVITCAIFGDSRLRGEFVESGNFPLPLT